MNKELKHNSKQNTAAERAGQLSKLFALISISVGALVLLGWTFDIQLLKSVLPGFVSMKANAAIGFFLLGYLLILNGNKKIASLYSKIITVFVLLLGLLTLLEYLFNMNVGIDQLIFLDSPGAALTSNPGRMAPTTAVMFILLSSALIFFQNRLGHRTAQVFSLFVMATGFVSFMGYAYSVSALFQFHTYTAMALHTAILFILLSLGILFSKPQVGFMKILLSRNVGGAMMRRILPVAILLPFLIGWIHVNSQYFELLPLGIAEIILDVINVTLFSILIFWLANSLNMVDIKREQGKEELIKQNAVLNAIINNSHSVIIFMLDKNYRYVAFNENHKLEMKKVYNVEIAVGMKLLDLITIPEVKEKAKASIDRVLAGETFVETEIQPDVNIYYEFHWNVVKKEGEIIGASCFVIDITEREKAVEKVRESEMKYRQLFDDDLSGNFITSVDGTILLANPALAGIFGFKTAGEMCGLNIVSFYKSPKSREPFLNLLREKKKLEDFDREFIRRDGSVLSVIENVIGEFDEKGELVRIKGYLFDNTQRKLAEEALQESEKSYRKFFDEDLTGDFKSTPDGKMLMCNSAFVRIVGCDSVEQVLQINTCDFYVGQADRIEFLNKLKEKGKLELYEATLRGCDGRIIHVIENVLGKYNEKGELVEISGYLFDITDRKKAELDLIESGKKYRQLIENASEIILLTDKNGNFTFANDAALKFSGYTFEEMTSFNFLDLVHKDHKKKVSTFYYRQLIRKDETTSLQFPFYTKDRSFKWLEQNVKLLTEGEKITGFQLIARDITKRKEAEEKVLLLSRAVEKSPATIMITDAEGNIEYVNQKFIDLTGYTFEEVKGKNPRILKSGEKSEEEYKELWKTIKSGKEWRGEFHNRKKNGELYWESASIVQIKNGKTFYLAVKEDITERKLVEEELIKAKEIAEQSNKLKDSFIANISHEIRTPLNGILGMTSIIKEIYSPNINGDEVEYFTAINKSSERIIRTIDLILNYSQLETRTFTFIPKQIELSTICKSLVSKFGVAAKSKSLSLSFDNKLGQVFIAASEYSITQVISNLIENAIIYTKSGFVKVHLYQSAQDEIMLDVIDSGIGISSKYLDHIFEPYRQEEMGYGRPYEGLGLGLALVKKILDLHNATTSVKSKKGEGTTFTINFVKSLQIVEELTAKQNIATKVEITSTKIDCLVLIVEDDVINQSIIKKFINRKYNTLVADSHDSVMEILKNNKVDLILMDISLQGSKDGLEITKELKVSREYKQIPIIAATAHTLERDHKAVMAAGCDDYLAKPFSMNQLLGKIDKFMQ
ncbi:MAG: PAS domain S-box protein [Ignavibacteriaceae bacterium]|nr:PAS domain S-box protein [Ignavibacteriaceae bacterium]